MGLGERSVELPVVSSWNKKLSLAEDFSFGRHRARGELVVGAVFKVGVDRNLQLWLSSYCVRWSSFSRESGLLVGD